MTALDRRYDTQIHRRITRTVMVGDVAIGSDHPVVVQSMINEDTLDIDAAVAGIVRLAEAGSEIVRVTTPSMAHARAMGEIRAAVRARGCMVPLVADVHHNGVKIASPAVGLALSGGALSGIVNHVCHLEELSTLGLREAGENLLISTISAGAVAHSLWTNGEKLWVPPLDKYASANASALRHLEPPADNYGLQDAGRLFDLPRVAQCASCIAISEEATTDGGVEAAAERVGGRRLGRQLRRGRRVRVSLSLGPREILILVNLEIRGRSGGASLPGPRGSPPRRRARRSPPGRRR